MRMEEDISVFVAFLMELCRARAPFLLPLLFPQEPSPQQRVLARSCAWTRSFTVADLGREPATVAAL